MLLSPIFLALGAVATSVLNAGGRFAASALAPIVYNLAIIGGAPVPRPVARRRRAGDRRRRGVARPPPRPAPAAARGSGFRYTPRIDAGDPQARRALVLMAPRALGLGATPDHVHRRDGARDAARASGRSPTSTSRSRCSRSRSGSSACRSGSSLLPSLSRDAAVGREVGVRGAPDAGAPAAPLRDDPDRGADRGRSASRSSSSCSASGQFGQADLALIADDAASASWSGCRRTR